jgi:hypothetical protein
MASDGLADSGAQGREKRQRFRNAANSHKIFICGDTLMAVPAYSHIVVVVMENQNYSDIAGNSQAPYINSLMAGGANLTNFNALMHPSQPNYFALYAGSTFGTTDDNAYTEPDPTLYTVLHGAGLTFAGYVDQGGGGSDFNHDPWVSFPEGRTVQTDFTSFPALFPSGNYASLPSVSYVIPSITNDMHSGTIAQGDTWLQANLAAYAQWALTNNSLLVVVWDESNDTTSQTTNQVPAILYGANVAPGNYNTAYNDYNLLSTITGSFGLTAPNNAATAAPIDVFGSVSASPAITAPANGSTDTTTTKPVISGTGIAGDTVTVSIDGAVAGTALVGGGGGWSYTPTAPLSNGSHTIAATQAAPGGASSAPTTDIFTVNVSSGGSSSVNAKFSGISDPNNYPPENALAVSSSFVVMAESSKIEWTNLTGGAAVTQSFYTLFAALPAAQRNSLLDARVAYDSVNQRFVVMAENLGSNASNIDIAVSKDSNPNDGWYVGSVNSLLTINGSATFADMPYLSVDGTNIYVSEYQYGSTLVGTQEWVFSDSGIYTGGALQVVKTNLAPANQGNARNVSDGAGKTYYVSIVPSGGQSVLTVQTYNAGTNTFNTTTALALGNSDQGPGSSTYTVAQLGTSLLLNAYDARIGSLAYANGFVYGVSEVEPAGASQPAIHWFKINVSNPNAPTLAAQGDITGAAIGAGVGVFNGSIAVDAAGDVMVNFTASGASMYPADYYVYATAGSSTFSAPALYQSSTGFFNSGVSGAQRWGAYSTAVADPNNPNGFWISNEYVANNWWQTVTANVILTTGVAATPPTLGGAGVTASYTQGGAAATLDSGLTVADPSSTTLSGATVSIGSGFFAGDALNFANQNGIIGSYNSTTGVLTLAGSASLAAYQTALDSVSFSSTSANPTNYGTDLARTINWQVSAGSLQSAVVSSTVNVVGVDQRPVLSGAGNTSTYTSGGVAVVIDNALAASDPDNLKLASATVTITGNYQTGDVLGFTNQNGITGSLNAGVLTLSGLATVAQYQSALDSVTFSTSSANAASRVVSWQVSDGTQSSVAVTSTVSLAAPPTLGGAGVTASYTQGGAAATLDSGLTVADPSSTTLSGATVSIGSGFFAGDALNFVNQNGITGSYNATTGVLTLAGAASLAAYQTALDSVSFSSTSANPTNYGTDLARTINWQVSAGSLKSTVVSSTVNVVGVDQRPVLSGAGNTSAYTSGGVAVVIDNALAASDPDNLSLASATVTITGNYQTGDVLGFTNQNGITGSLNAGVLTLSGLATVAQYQTALDSVTFSTSSANAASRVVSWQVSDGTQSSVAVTSTVAFGSGGQTYTLTTATDTISAGSGNDTIIAPSPSTLTSADSVNGGAGSNTLLLQGAGSYTLPSTLSNIQTLSVPGVAGGTTSVSLSSSLDNLMITIGQGVQNETFSVDASGSGNDTFVLTPNFGQLTIANFADSGPYVDIVQFNASMFSYLTPSTMTQAQEAQAVLSNATQSGGNVSITDSLGDRLMIGGTDIATLSANLGDFKFI